MARVVVEGAAQLRRTLRQAGADMKILRDVNKAAAQVVASAAASSAPRRSGRLAGSIRAGATQRAGVVRAGRKSVPYAGPIHWGWPARNIRANPWLANTAQATESRWVDEYMQQLERAIDQVRGI